jgi:hypothetical protein
MGFRGPSLTWGTRARGPGRRGLGGGMLQGRREPQTDLACLTAPSGTAGRQRQTDLMCLTAPRRPAGRQRQSDLTCLTAPRRPAGRQRRGGGGGGRDQEPGRHLSVARPHRGLHQRQLTQQLCARVLHGGAVKRPDRQTEDRQTAQQLCARVFYGDAVK